MHCSVLLEFRKMRWRQMGWRVRAEIALMYAWPRLKEAPASAAGMRS